MRDLPISIISLSGAIAEDAAWIWGASGIGLEDAVHLATARASGATAFVTNDRRLRRVNEIEVVLLDDFIGN